MPSPVCFSQRKGLARGSGRQEAQYGPPVRKNGSFLGTIRRIQRPQRIWQALQALFIHSPRVRRLTCPLSGNSSRHGVPARAHPQSRAVPDLRTAQTAFVPSAQAAAKPAGTEDARQKHTRTDHIRTNHIRTEHIRSDHAGRAPDITAPMRAAAHKATKYKTTTPKTTAHQTADRTGV